jgi:hypothetical protein
MAFRVRARLSGALIPVLAVAAGACGRPPLGPPTPIPAADYGSTIVDRKCARAVACGQMPDMASCVASMSTDFSQFFDEVSAGRLIYDGAAAAQCFAATSLVGVPCTMTAQAAVPNDPSCAHIFTGAQAEGDPCGQPDECVSATCNIDPLTDCSGTPVCCTGTCAPPGPAAAAPVAVGGDCSAAGSSCVAGAFCSTLTALCVARLAVGQPCDATMDRYCSIGLTCGPAASGTQPVCLAPPAEGESCATLMPCDGLDDYCDPLARKCLRKVVPGGFCQTGACCVDYARWDGGTTCVADAKLGDPCELSMPPFCLGSLDCTHGFCELPLTSLVCP